MHFSSQNDTRMWCNCSAFTAVAQPFSGRMVKVLLQALGGFWWEQKSCFEPESQRLVLVTLLPNCLWVPLRAELLSLPWLLLKQTNNHFPLKTAREWMLRPWGWWTTHKKPQGHLHVDVCGLHPAVQLCPEGLGMWNPTLAGLRMELHKAAVGSFGSRQLDLAMTFLQPCVFLLAFGVLQSFHGIENRHKHKPRYAQGREVVWWVMQGIFH